LQARKAFAASPASGVGLSAGRRTTHDPEKQALKNCKKLPPKNAPCAIIATDEQKAFN
jgi:hypothetical protein